jgi:hypothetical protein
MQFSTDGFFLIFKRDDYQKPFKVDTPSQPDILSKAHSVKQLPVIIIYLCEK